MKVQRLLIPGSEWLYLKLYLGTQITNSVLVNYIAPLTTDLLKKRIIEEFFFIRYVDNSNHIRLRMKLSNRKNIGNIINNIHDTLYMPINSGIIWNIQYCSYLREIERYGENTMEIAESIFFRNSQIVLELLKNQEINKLYFSLLLINQYMNRVNYNTTEKYNFCQKMSDFYQKEFSLNNPEGYKQLNNKYRLHKDNINILFNSPHQEYKSLLQTHNQYIIDLFEQINTKSRLNELQLPLESFLSSIIHMFIDRLCTSDNRLYELVCYYLLEKYYLSLRFKTKSLI